MSDRSSVLSGLSTFQLVAGALAAMTSAWLASALGVGGTIAGAAFGSLVVTVTSTFYANSLDRGRTLVVQTADGRSVETRAEPGETAEALAEAAEAADSPVTGAEFTDDEEETAGPPWKRIIVSTVAVLAIALATIGVYEATSGNSYGAGSDNARISSPFSGGGSSSGDHQNDSGRQDGGTGTDPQEEGDEEEQTEEPRSPAQETRPTPTPERTTPAPTTDPAPAPTPPPAP